MKSPKTRPSGRGFTLMELMVAMAITTIIVTVLVSITSIAVDTWNRSRAEVRAARQAKAMVDSMAADLEALVSRRGNTFEWLSARSNPPAPSANATELVFFTAATDRYRGQIGTGDDNGGDVSCVGYRLDYKDPINGGKSENQTFVLNRYLVDPDKTFADLLGKPELDSAFSAAYDAELTKVENFICENVYQFTLSFLIQYTVTTGTTTTEKIEKVVVGPGTDASELSLKGNGINLTPPPSTAELAGGRLVAVEVSLTVLSDSGIDQLRRSPALGQDAKFLARNSYQYSKVVQLPSM